MNNPRFFDILKCLRFVFWVIGYFALTSFLEWAFPKMNSILMSVLKIIIFIIFAVLTIRHFRSDVKKCKINRRIYYYKSILKEREFLNLPDDPFLNKNPYGSIFMEFFWDNTTFIQYTNLRDYTNIFPYRRDKYSYLMQHAKSLKLMRDYLTWSLECVNSIRISEKEQLI